MNVRTLEHGRFYVGPNGHRRFAGTASGVYLADTVRHHLSTTSYRDKNVPNTNRANGNSNTHRDAGIMEAFISQLEGSGPSASYGSQPLSTFEPYLLTTGDMSNVAELQKRFNAYFATWHPLFPFLDGQTTRSAFRKLVEAGKSKGTPSGHHGPTFQAVAGPSHLHASSSSSKAARNGIASLMSIWNDVPGEEALVVTAVLRSIFFIAGPSDPTLGSSIDTSAPTFSDTSSITQLAYVILSACEAAQVDLVAAVQAMFALALALYTARQFRPASHLLGMLNRLHRCPGRYPKTFVSPSEQELRKRIFFSLYVLDRLLSKQLGMPLQIRDIDIDTCLPGAEEIHGAVHSGPDGGSKGKGRPAPSLTQKYSQSHVERGASMSSSFNPGQSDVGSTLDASISQHATTNTTNVDPISRKRSFATMTSPVPPPPPTSTAMYGHSTAHLPPPVSAPGSPMSNQVHPSNPHQTVDGEIDTPNTAFIESKSSQSQASLRLLPMFTLVQLTGIMGRVMETFNGSRRWRAANDAARIKTDLEAWWYDFELDMQDSIQTGISDPRAKYMTLFRCLYNQQIMHIYRHSLSLPPESNPHRNALQASILASRTICSNLGTPQALHLGEIRWPGYVDMLFDAGLVLAYGSKLSDKLSDEKAASSLHQALQALIQFEGQWKGLQPVISVIQELVRKVAPAGHLGALPTPPDWSLDWLLNADFNIEGPSGPDMFTPMMGNTLYSGRSLTAPTGFGMGMGGTPMLFPSDPWQAMGGFMGTGGQGWNGQL